jgi:hypothetical protein
VAVRPGVLSAGLDVLQGQVQFVGDLLIVSAPAVVAKVDRVVRVDAADLLVVEAWHVCLLCFLTT